MLPNLMKDISLSLNVSPNGLNFLCYLWENSLWMIMTAKIVEADSLKATKSLEMQIVLCYFINEVNWRLTGVNKNNLFLQYLALACNWRNCSQNGNSYLADTCSVLINTVKHQQWHFRASCKSYFWIMLIWLGVTRGTSH